MRYSENFQGLFSCQTQVESKEISRSIKQKPADLRSTGFVISEKTIT